MSKKNMDAMNRDLAVGKLAIRVKNLEDSLEQLEKTIRQVDDRLKTIQKRAY